MTSTNGASPSAPICTSLTIQTTRPPLVRQQTRKYRSGPRTPKLAAVPRGAQRVGRPPRELSGEVDERIQDAAQEVFLERGLGGASVDEIAGRAGAGKPTIYARFLNKEALYTAVMLRMVEVNLARVGLETISGTSLEQRLTNLARSLFRWILASDSVGLIRLAIAEARCFPDLASTVTEMIRQHGTAAVGRLLAEAARSGEFGPMPAFAPERLMVTT
jgi:AcrR family transcriptional regulator